MINTIIKMYLFFLIRMYNVLLIREVAKVIISSKLVKLDVDIKFISHP